MTTPNEPTSGEMCLACGHSKHVDDDGIQYAEDTVCGEESPDGGEVCVCDYRNIELLDYRAASKDDHRTIAAFLAEVERLTVERDGAQANYRWMVEHAADEKLDGYRELGARAAAAENEADSLRRLAEIGKLAVDGYPVYEASKSLALTKAIAAYVASAAKEGRV